MGLFVTHLSSDVGFLITRVWREIPSARFLSIPASVSGCGPNEFFLNPLGVCLPFAFGRSAISARFWSIPASIVGSFRDPTFASGRGKKKNPGETFAKVSSEETGHRHNAV
jgi:hypothetical protein